ncbi:MAG: hypothetical protein SPJ19_02465 [Candidatus Borkfalkiaceae bacterium]|nr:hypothetical protein [Christensenellaceae bacterium]
MPVEVQIILAVTIVAIIAIPLIFVFAVWLPNYKSTMARAKKIDPSVNRLPMRSTFFRKT